MIVAAFAEEAHASSQERTYIMLKPDGVHRGLVRKRIKLTSYAWSAELSFSLFAYGLQISEVIARFERKGYKLVAIKIMVPSKDLAGKHYAEHEDK